MRSEKDIADAQDLLGRCKPTSQLEAGMLFGALACLSWMREEKLPQAEEMQKWLIKLKERAASNVLAEMRRPS